MQARHSLIAVVTSLVAALGAAAPAYAQEATPDSWMSSAVASKSREQVQAELAAARKDGTAKAVTPGYDFAGRVASQKSREQVRADLYAARESGEYEQLNAEAHAFRATPRSTAYASGR